jgi:ribose transport system permease protein
MPDNQFEAATTGQQIEINVAPETAHPEAGTRQETAPAEEPAGTSRGRGRSRNPLAALLRMRELSLLLFIVVGMIVLNFFQANILSVGNVELILLGISFDAIIAVGMTILLVSGGFDLSVGAVMALSGIVSALLMTSGMSVPLAILCGLASGLLVGLVNGFFVAYVGVNPFITTLGTTSVVQGITLLISQSGVAGLPDSFTILGQGTIFTVQYPIIVMAVIIVVGDILLRNARFLRKNYYIGGNERSAILSGIAVNRIKLFNYALTGLLAALAGILTAARESNASPTTGSIDALNIIAAVVIGGASLSGGEGTVLGSFLGLFLLQLINNAITGFGFNPNWGPLITGTVLIIAVTTDLLGRRLRLRRKPRARFAPAKVDKAAG